MLILSLACAACAPQSDVGQTEAVPIETACSVTDGDTIRCGDERIRLLGIDAPELPGHCRIGRECAPGDPYVSTDSLVALVEKGPLSIIRMGEDRFGRTLALVRAGEVDLSCHQLATGNAIYVARWDDERAVQRTCPGIARD